MNRIIAKNIHEAVNASFWIENKDWDADSSIANLACDAVRHLPFSIHQFQKQLCFNNPEDITVSGESIVVPTGDIVDKYMFRYPREYSETEFYTAVSKEVDTVTSRLAGIALPTMVSIKTADIFKAPLTKTSAVTQTQRRINLSINQPLDIELIDNKNLANDRTAKDIEKLLNDTDVMVEKDGLYPDIAFSSANLRRNIFSGKVTLIDVMPLHADGTRLIGDSLSKLPHTLESIAHYENFVGHYGS